MKPDVDISHLEPEKKSGPTDVTPTRPMRALSRSTYSPTEDLTAYAAPLPKGSLMFPNWTGWKSIKALLFTLVTFNAVFMTAGVFSASTQHLANIASLFFGAAGIVVTTLSGTAAGTPAVAKLAAAKMAARVTSTLLVLFTLLLVACSSCSATQQAQEVTLGVDTLVCVLNHDTDSYQAIALECGVSDLTSIASIINAAKAAAIRDRYLDGGSGQ
jgi:hypothetical protein